MLEDFSPTALRDTFRRYFATEVRHQISTESRAAVADWRWATGEMWRPEPFCEQCGGSSARWHGRLSWRRSDSLRHGLDPQQRTPIAEEWSFNGKKTPEPHGEAYLLYQPNRLETIRYRYPDRAEPELLQRFRFESGVLHCVQSIAVMHCSETRYFWESGVLQRSVSVCWRHLYQSTSNEFTKLKATARIERRFEYDSAGALHRILEQRLQEDGAPNTDLPQKEVYKSTLWSQWWTRLRG